MNFRCVLSGLVAALVLVSNWTAVAEDFTTWRALPTEFKPVAITPANVSLQSSPWAYWTSPQDAANVDVSTMLTIDAAATQFQFFGSSWSVWPDAKFGDQGFEAALLLRAKDDGSSGYRVQISSKHQEVALVRFPDGGYVRSVPCVIKRQTPIKLRATAAGGALRVFVDGQELIHYVDRLNPILERGRVGVGASSAARVTFSELQIKAIEPEVIPITSPHAVKLAVRPWIGGRRWVFDGAEPILLLPAPESSYINNVKLRPGHKPQLSWNSHWDTQNQGAYAEATNETVDVQVSGGGESLVATWRGKHKQDRFGTKSRMTIGFNPQRATYTYDIESELEVFAGEPFHFRYGFDFEHHTPLDPFNWQYLVARKRGGELYHRPVYPIDPGPQNDLEMYHGLRVWYGRHNGDLRVAPAVEYETSPDWNQVAGAEGKTSPRACNTAVCAAFYDTGVSFGPETAKAGTKVRVKYRYTGYPADEAKALFDQSKVYDSPTLDPQHHYIFADEWPKLTFSQFVPMSETWVLGRSPFMTGHNQRPTYELVKNCGAGSGFAMKLGPASYGKATLSKSGPLSKGRYVVTALIKSDNTLGAGGRIEIEATQAKTNKKLVEAKHFVGAGTFDWKSQGFAFEVPEDAGALNLGLGNSGTGEFFVTNVEFRKLADGEAVPSGVLAKANDQPAPQVPTLPGAMVDYRMLEGKGLHVLNHAGEGHLDLANLDFVTVEGRPALRFAENVSGKERFRADSTLGRSYLGHPAYAGRGQLPLALAGHHGGGQVLTQGLTIAAWVRPAAEMGRSTHGGKGDIVGYGGRRFILSLNGQKAPYQPVARINVNDSITADARLEADRWYHLALTAEPSNGQWQVRLYVDGKQAGEGRTTKFPADSVVPHSIILGAEIFYFHDAYYRGLIGRTLILNRVMTAEELQSHATEPTNSATK